MDQGADLVAQRTQTEEGAGDWENSPFPLKHEVGALVLDHEGILHLLELKRGFVMAKVKRELGRWPIRDTELVELTTPGLIRGGMWHGLKLTTPDGVCEYVTTAYVLPKKRKALRFLLKECARPRDGSRS
jgi:hypothetical protein